MKKLQAKITISRWTSNKSEGGVTISVVDELSGCPMVEIDMPLQAFAEALMGLGRVPCVAEFNDSGVIGKKREHKTEVVTFQDLPWGMKREERIAALANVLKPYEIDGWRGRAEDANNSHNRAGVSADGRFQARIIFERYVDADKSTEASS